MWSKFVSIKDADGQFYVDLIQISAVVISHTLDNRILSLNIGNAKV